MKPYVVGQSLGEDEYVLKIRPARNDHEYPTGFIAKLTKKNELMKSFDEWNGWGWGNPEPLPVFVYKETFKTGWKLESWRFGESRNWARMIHPDGFALEIYLDDFLKIILTHTITNGVIDGIFKWENKTLVSPT
jgi:hypothetical protein